MSMQLTCLDLLPYSSNIVLQNSNKIISILKKLDLILEGVIESQISFFQNKNYGDFDPHHNEACCEVRAVNLMLRATHFSKSSFEINYQLEHYRRMKEKVTQQIIFFTQQKKQDVKLTLIDFLREQELIFLISLIDQYIFVSYFLTKKNIRENDAAIVKKLTRHYKTILPQLSRVTIICISSDITDRKKLEAALQAAKKQAETLNRAKTEFLENMRHDIRTPLTGIIGFARLIQKEARRPHIKEYADNLVQATSALLDFQNEILDAIKVTTETSPIILQPFNLKNLVEKVLNLVRPKAILKKLELLFHYDHNLPLFYIGDSKRLFRILLELVTNALKFTAEGNIRVALTAFKKNDRQLIVRFDVSDTGIGIPQDQQDDVFVRFHRLSPSSDGIYEGTGLGLTVVKQYVKDLNGKIEIDSIIGKGATFVCLIPFSVADHAVENTSDHKIELVNEVLFQHKNILLVEDHQMTATVTELMLTELQCFVENASDARTALLKASEKKYDLIFLDLGLPDMTGFELAKKIRHDDNAINYSSIIVALTAHSEEESKLRCFESGIDAVFQKPLLKSKAITILNAFLSDDLMKKPVIDLVLGAKRVGKDELAAKEMLNLLRRHIPEDKKNIEHALVRKNWSQLREHLHKLQGGLSYCGAPRIEFAATQLQQVLDNAEVMNIPRFSRDLLTEIDRLIAAVN